MGDQIFVQPGIKMQKFYYRTKFIQLLKLYLTMLPQLNSSAVLQNLHKMYILQLENQV